MSQSAASPESPGTGPFTQMPPMWALGPQERTRGHWGPRGHPTQYTETTSLPPLTDEETEARRCWRPPCRGPPSKSGGVGAISPLGKLSLRLGTVVSITKSFLHPHTLEGLVPQALPDNITHTDVPRDPADPGAGPETPRPTCPATF